MRRAFAAIEEEAGAAWLRRHLDDCTAPLLAEPWILDMDTTVKPLYGRQEGAVVGYNPKKPGRPSHCYHTYSLAGPRLVLDVDVRAGNEHTSKHRRPACGRCWIEPRAIAGPRCCAATPASAMSRSCTKPNSAAWLICSSCD